MKKTLLKTTLAILIFVSVLSFSMSVAGQTNPTPFDLNTGSYEFNSWDSLNAAGTYPQNMVFQYVAANQTAAFYTEASSDYTCPYNGTKRPRIIGLVNHGIDLITTSSSQYNDCVSGTASSRFIGAVLLSLNTTERNNVNVSFKSETVVPGDGNGTASNPRVWKLRLQYRVGNTGVFSDVPGPVEFISSLASGDSAVLGPVVLPLECNNQPEVQLRWIYFEWVAGAGGSRPQLRLDDIEVTSDQTVGLKEDQANSGKMFSIFPNPAHAQFTLNTKSDSKGTIMVIDQVGRLVMLKNFDRNTAVFNCSNLPKGVYVVKVTDVSSGQSKTNKLLIQ